MQLKPFLLQNTDQIHTHSSVWITTSFKIEPSPFLIDLLTNLSPLLPPSPIYYPQRSRWPSKIINQIKSLSCLKPSVAYHHTCNKSKCLFLPSSSDLISHHLSLSKLWSCKPSFWPYNAVRFSYLRDSALIILYSSLPPFSDWLFFCYSDLNFTATSS